MNKGAILYFRDYARYDLAQLRFAQRKKNKVGDNLYMRKDKTLSYFFKKEEIEKLFIECGFFGRDLIERILEDQDEVYNEDGSINPGYSSPWSVD